MTVNSIGNSSFYEKARENSNKKQKTENDFYENFVSNLEDKTISGTKTGEKNNNAEVRNMNYHFHTVSVKIPMQPSGQINTDAVSPCSVGNITYAESDYVKVCTAEGYTLKAQVKSDENKVYVEQKNEDGTVQGYEINPLKLDKNTKNPVEQLALEAWGISGKVLEDKNVTDKEQSTGGNRVEDIQNEEKEKDEWSGLTWEEAMEKFYYFVEDRIKNGPPKIQTGAAEFSIDEWNRLLEKVDESLDESKEELRKRIEKLKEKEENKEE